jgi:hypothetical protein
LVRNLGGESVHGILVDECWIRVTEGVERELVVLLLLLLPQVPHHHVL